MPYLMETNSTFHTFSIYAIRGELLVNVYISIILYKPSYVLYNVIDTKDSI